MKILKYLNKILPFFKKKNNKRKFKNILVVSNTGVGDTVLASPAIKTLRKSFPKLNITFLINEKMYPLYEDFKYVDDFILFKRGFFNQLKLIWNLRKRDIDTIFLFHSNGPEDIFFSILSGASNILKMTNSSQHEYKKIFLNKLNDQYQHIIERKIDLVRAFDPKIIDTTLELPKHFRKEKFIFTKEEDYKYIGLQMGAQDLYKIWPLEKFINLSKRILKNHKVKIVLLGASKLEKQMALKLVEQLDSEAIINLCGKTCIRELPYLLNQLDLLVTNDTGAMHLAIALKRRTISLFGPTDSKIYGPYQDFDKHCIIQKDGFFVNNIPKKQRTQKGIDLIKIDEVYDIIISKGIV